LFDGILVHDRERIARFAERRKVVDDVIIRGGRKSSLSFCLEFGAREVLQGNGEWAGVATVAAFSWRRLWLSDPASRSASLYRKRSRHQILRVALLETPRNSEALNLLSTTLPKRAADHIALSLWVCRPTRGGHCANS